MTDAHLDIDTARQLENLERQARRLVVELKVMTGYEALRKLIVFVLVSSVIVLVLAMITFQFGKMYVLVAPVLLLLFFVLPLAALDHIFSTIIVLFGFFLLYVAYDAFVLVKKFPYFADIFGNIGNVMDVSACDKMFCQGWKAYMYFLFYVSLFVNFLIAGACLYLTFRVMSVDILADKDQLQYRAKTNKNIKIV